MNNQPNYPSPAIPVAGQAAVYPGTTQQPAPAVGGFGSVPVNPAVAAPSAGMGYGTPGSGAFAGANLDSEGTSRLPFLAMGQHRVKIVKTEFKQYTRSIVVEFEYIGSNTNSELTGQRCSKIFATSGKNPEQTQFKLEDWTRFIRAAMGFNSLKEFHAAGHNQVQLLDLCAIPAGMHPQAQPVTGRILDVLCTDSGARTKPSKKDPVGGKVITNEAWLPIAA